MQIPADSAVTVVNARPHGVLLLLASVLLLPNISVASDVAIYECKPKTADMGEKLAKDVARADADAGAAMQAGHIHNIYKFDFINKTVTYRALDNKGKESEFLGIGQTSKYTAEITIDGDNVTWNDVLGEDPTGSITEINTFNLKNHKIHQSITMKLAPGVPPPPGTSVDQQPMDDDLSCTPYSAKH
jgi:hypothetical protein